MNRREIYARVALADLPMPSTIRLYEAGGFGARPCIVLEFMEELDEAEQWVRSFGLEPTRRVNSEDRCMDLDHGQIVWLGCEVQVNGHRKPGPGVQSLSAELRAVLEQLVDDEPRCGTCGEPASLLASGAVSHAGDGRGNPCGPAGSDRGVPDLRTDDDPYCCPTLPDDAVLEHRIDEEPAGFTPDEYEQIEARPVPVRHGDDEVVTGPAALAGHVPGEVYERDEPITVRAQPPCDPCTMGEHCQQCGCCNGLLDGFPVGRGPGRRGLPFADVDPATVVIR